MEVPTLQDHQQLAEAVRHMEQKLELVSLALSFANWISHTEAQRILGIARLDTLHEWKAKGKIEMRAISERKYEVSLLSIASYLISKGYTLQGVQERVAA